MLNGGFQICMCLEPFLDLVRWDYLTFSTDLIPEILGSFFNNSPSVLKHVLSVLFAQECVERDSPLNGVLGDLRYRFLQSALYVLDPRFEEARHVLFNAFAQL